MRFEVKLEDGWASYSGADQEMLRVAWNTRQQDTFSVAVDIGTVYIDSVNMRQLRNPAIPARFRPIRIVSVPPVADAYEVHPQLDSASQFEVELNTRWHRYSAADQESLRVAWNGRQQDTFSVAVDIGTVYIDSVNMRQLMNPALPARFRPIRIVHVPPVADAYEVHPQL